MYQPYVETALLAPYHMLVNRVSMSPLGNGDLYVYSGKNIVAVFKVITGGNVLDPTAYGGITPPLDWIPVESMDNRSPDGVRDPYRMSRIVPSNRGFADAVYPDRTFALPPERLDPFMIHFGSAVVGASTGCIVVLERQDEFMTIFNEIYRMGTFIIRVQDSPIV